MHKANEHLTHKTPRKQTTKLRLQNFQKRSVENVLCCKLKEYKANAVDPDEAVFANAAIVVFGALRVRTQHNAVLKLMNH